MPSPSIHQSILDRNKTTLDRLLALKPENSVDNFWILTIAYYKVLHHVELAADRINPEDNRLRSHAERLEFLELRDVRAKQYFNKLFIISEFVRYGIPIDAILARRAAAEVGSTSFRAKLVKWMDIIKKAC